MRLPSAMVRVLAVAAVWLGVLGTTLADGDDFKVIVHPGSPVTAVSRAFLRDAFLKKTTSWSHGPAIRPIDLPGSTPVRDRFTRSILRKTRAQLRSYWNQRIFSGKGVPPPEATSVASAVAFVVDHPGAVAYLPADADPGRAKVISVE